MADPWDEIGEGVGNLLGILFAAALGLFLLGAAFYYANIALQAVLAFLLQPAVLVLILLFVGGTVAVKKYGIYQRGKGESQTLYHSALLAGASVIADHEEPERELAQLLTERLGHEPSPLLVEVAEQVYNQEDFIVEAPPDTDDLVAHAAYRDEVRAKVATTLSSPAVHEDFVDAIVRALALFDQALPSHRDGIFTVPAISLLGNVGELINEMIFCFFDGPVLDQNLLAKQRARLDENLVKVNQKHLSAAAINAGQVLLAPEHPGTPQEIVDDYLSGTPLHRLFSQEVPFGFPAQTRFEHMHIVAPQGAGKTQCIQYLIAHDLEKVARNEASLFVMDSQGDLIRAITRLRYFRDHPDKLVLIEPDPEFPPALNVFDLGSQTTPREKERAANATLELLTYVFSGLLGAQMTIKQETLWRHAVRACLEIPNATILTLQELISSKSPGAYAPFFEKLDPQTRRFLDSQFYDRQFDHTRQEVGWRLSFLLENATFRRMFSSARTSIDLASELLSSKVVCINTDKDLLGEERTQIFGRFFIALLLQASRQRASLARGDRQPLYCYIDEAQDYIASDPHVATLLDQARKQNVALTLAHQRCGQLSPPVLDALLNVSIKLAHGSLDSRKLAPHLRSTPEFIEAQPKGRFAAFIRNSTPTAVSVRVPFGHLEGMDRMSEEEWRIIQDGMRRTYSVYASGEAEAAREEGNDPPQQERDRARADTPPLGATRREAAEDDLNWRS